MTVQEARRIISYTQKYFFEKQTILKGLSILSMVDDDVQCSFEHDIIFASSFEKTVACMSDQDVESMAKYGWFESEESWAHH